MANNEKKGVTVKIDAELHAEVKRYIEEHEMTMGDFVALALHDELHPQFNIKEEKTMGNMRTLAFQVPEELFQKIKDYLQRNNITQKEFVIGLIETEIERDLTQRATASEETTDFEEVEEQDNDTVSDNFYSENEESEASDEDEDLDESEDQGIAMGM